MKFKVLKGTELFNQLTAINKRMYAAKDAADKLTASLPFKVVDTATRGYNLAGGIDAFHCPDGCPEGWKVVGESWQNLYYPKVKGNKDLLAKISALPLIKYDDINELINFRPQGYTTPAGLAWAKGPGIVWAKTYVLIETSEGLPYKPVPDMIEITVSEFDKLKKKVTDKEKEIA